MPIWVFHIDYTQRRHAESAEDAEKNNNVRTQADHVRYLSWLSAK